MALTDIETAARRGFDVTIIGSGPAGCYLAGKLAAADANVLILERGALDEPDDGGGDYALDVTGLAYKELGDRLTGFGGTSNHWAGQSRPIAPEVFAGRDDIPGWPIAWNDFAHYLPEAAAWLNLGDVFAETDADAAQRGFLRGSRRLAADTFKLSVPIMRLGDGPNGKAVREHPRIHVATGARVVDLALDENGRTVKNLKVYDEARREFVTLPVGVLVLAAGGIENPRLMLSAGRKLPAGNPLSGGPNALTGRFMQEHPVIQPWDIFFDSRIDMSTLGWRRAGESVRQSGLHPSDEIRRRFRLPRIGSLFHGFHQAPTGEDMTALAAMRDLYAFNPDGYIRTSPGIMFEPRPHEGSFVALSRRSDSLGYPLARLHLALAEADYDAFERVFTVFGGLLGQPGLGHARLRPRFTGARADWQIGWGSHHMGATRMAADPRDGVVDADCRVHGLGNMYVAGSSVFPASDYVNPTLNLVALTGRLAAHLTAQPTIADALPRFRALRFGIGARGNQYLGAGWSHPEDGAVWSVGPLAIIRLPVRGASTIRFDFEPFRRWLRHHAKIEILINGRSVFSGAAGDARGTAFPVADGGDGIEVRFRIRNPTSPKDLNMSDDLRKLGIYLHSLSVE